MITTNENSCVCSSEDYEGFWCEMCNRTDEDSIFSLSENNIVANAMWIKRLIKELKNEDTKKQS